ncbi:MAG: hypothetical protein B7Z37_27365 [Verrucomicrobia bacterium 12-59-8]|nr:MAG: hypothetical protein B7Z37_27365 [Verrucomicrobia bacterium 12-59-8]
MELKRLYDDHFAETVLKRMTSGKTGGAMTKKMLCDWMGEHIGPKTTPKPGQEGKGKEIIEMPKATGRARFSRPALRLVKELLLSGLSPAEFKAALLDLNNPAYDELRKAVKLVGDGGREMNTQEMRGMIAADLDFLDNIGASWDKISIRDERLEAISELTQAEKEARQAAITRMIGMEINPKIRHRLTLLDHILDEVIADGRPLDRVVLEFAREEWLGPKRRKELMDFQAERKQQNITARLSLGGEVTQKAVLKHQLLTEQGGRCLFCGKNFSNPKTTNVAHGELSFENAHLAHIVADSKGGPRAYVNLVLACDGCNRAQENRYHADAFAQNRFPIGWDAFMGIVSGCAGMRPFKKKILCTKSEDEAALMVQNKTALQETAWIAKLARVLICLKLGWKLDAEGEERRIVVVTGSVTNRVATRYGLYSLLGGPERVKKLADAKAAIETAVKNVEEASDDELDKLCDDFPKEWKMKKRKGADHWDKDHALWLLRRLHIANEDEINEKDRKDDRHHALDAMVLSFLSHKAGNPRESLYFGLPPGKNWKEEFSLRLSSVQAESLRFEKPVLRETIYGLRPGESGKLSAVIRREVFPMAYGGLTPDGKLIKFAVGNLRSRLPSIRIKSISSLLGAIANDLEGIADGQKREKEWYLLCQDLRLKPNGPLIKKVSCWSDKPEQANYCNMSKDWTPEREAAGKGQWRCAKGSHQGQWVYLDTLSKPRIRAVKVFESIAKVKSDLEADSDCARVVMFLQSGCIVKIDGEVKSGAKKLPEGNYRVGGVEEAARKIDLYSAGGTKFEKIPLTSLLTQNFRRVH